MKYNNENKNNFMETGIELINLFIGIIFTLICVLAYVTIESTELRYLIIGAVIVVALVAFISLLIKSHKNSKDKTLIRSIALVNEEEEIIREWQLFDKVSMLIGKNNKINKVDIDLSHSIYCHLIEDEHAVLNYAGGSWYVEDLCSSDGVSIKKIDDGIQYRAVKYSPCRIKKGDTLFIGKNKFLLR